MIFNIEIDVEKMTLLGFTQDGLRLAYKFFVHQNDKEPLDISEIISFWQEKNESRCPTDVLKMGLKLIQADAAVTDLSYFLTIRQTFIKKIYEATRV